MRQIFAGFLVVAAVFAGAAFGASVSDRSAAGKSASAELKAIRSVERDVERLLHRIHHHKDNPTNILRICDAVGATCKK